MRIFKITLTLCLITFIASAQTVYTVDNRSQSGAMFTVIQDAVDAATAGDIIQIHPSATSYGSISIGKRLNIVALGHDPITNDQGLTTVVGNIAFFGTAANSEIRGLTINAIILSGTVNNLDGIKIINNRINSAISVSPPNGLADSWLVEGNYFTTTGTAILTSADVWLIKNNFMFGGVSGLNVTNLVRNNIFFSTSNSTDFFFSNCTSTIISNNIFVTNGNMTEFGINNSTNLDFRNNLTYSYVGNTIVDLPGTNNLDNTNPMFVIAPTMTEDDFYDNDYHLLAGSPGTNYGTDGTSIGIFGNNFLFDPQGRPDLMPFPTSITINNNVVAPGQNLDVNFTAEQKQ
ncbi:hypothetical protein [Psychroserpens jangbogonensis]|uniref:hypothetical protein n=1 Tax=Psychroserpens jangbogonensis TaxID=1484460 RepID=UPI000AEE3A06|nr:hypothetical protein [Psychroserpens jangbogonensis]